MGNQRFLWLLAILQRSKLATITRAIVVSPIVFVTLKFSLSSSRAKNQDFLRQFNEASMTTSAGTWFGPNATSINNLTQVIGGSGVYGFIYNSSRTPDSEYGTYNWCNMPHVRAKEYVKPADEFELQYVEVVSNATITVGGYNF